MPATGGETDLLDSLAFATIDHDLSLRPASRDEADAAFTSVVASLSDSLRETPAIRQRVAQMDRLRAQWRREADALASRIRTLVPSNPDSALDLVNELSARFPRHPDLTALRSAVAASRSVTVPKPAPTIEPALPSSATPIGDSALQEVICDGIPRVSWREDQHILTVTEGAVAFSADIVSPCGLGLVRLVLDTVYTDTLLARFVAQGAWSIDAAVVVPEAPVYLWIEVCDTLNRCTRGPAIQAQIPSTGTSPTLFAAIAALVVLGGGIAAWKLQMRRRPAPAPVTRSGRTALAEDSEPETGIRGLVIRNVPVKLSPPPEAPLPTGPVLHPDGSVDLPALLRECLDRAIPQGSPGPRIQMRLSPSVPRLRTEPERLRRVVSPLFALAAHRAGPRGQLTVATGRGAMNLEIVLEDNAPVRDPAQLRYLFDEASTPLSERQGMDRELVQAAKDLHDLGGGLTAESRIDGGLRMRARLPLPVNPRIAA